MIWTYPTSDEVDEEDSRQRPLGVGVPELDQHVSDWVSIDPRYRPRREDGQAFVVDISGDVGWVASDSGCSELRLQEC